MATHSIRNPESSSRAVHARRGKRRWGADALKRSLVYLYRLRLGWLLGHWCLLLRYRDPRTGRVDRTVFGVVHYDPELRESIVIAGRAAPVDWYQQIQAQPALEVQTSGQRYAPVQRVLAPKEAAMVLATYARRHPWRGRLFLRLLGYRAGSSAEWRAISETVPMAAFRPHQIQF